jgi:cystatin-A/B
MPLVGGPGGLKEPDDSLHGVLAKIEEEIKQKIGEKLGAPPGSIKPLGYKTQVVAGTNYFIKLLVDEAKVIHARVFRNLQGEVSLHSVSDEKSADDEIEYF